MYEVFYKLKAEPFRLSPDHRFCFEHKGYAKAGAYMAYAFRRAEGFVMITGRPGTGKTTLIDQLVEGLSAERVFVANLVCTQLQADELLKSVAYSFGINSARLDKAELLQSLTVLLNRWHKENRRALLIVDEAQDLSLSAMEELRLLTNIQLSGQPLLQIFLLGQPELRDLILSAEMEQVHQRIVAASHIEGLEVEETEAYVMHRLNVVGWQGDPAIDRAIFPLIHKFSEGVPRRINLICSRLFLLGSVEESHAIEAKDVGVVIRELQSEGLAAGTEFSSDDFESRGQVEWVAVPGGVSQLQAETDVQTANDGHHVREVAAPVEVSQLQAETDVQTANDGNHVQGELDSVAVEEAKDSSMTDGAPQSTPPETPASPEVAADDVVEFQSDPGGDNMPDDLTVTSISEGVVPETEKVSSALEVRHRDNLRAIWQRVSSLGVIVVLIGSLVFILKDVLPPETLEMLAEFAGVNETESIISAPNANSPSMATEAIEARPVPGATIANAPQRQSAPDEKLANLIDTVLDEIYPDGEGPFPTQFDMPEEPGQVFSVSFSPDSDVLEPDTRHALDRAVVMLGEQPDRVALIADFSLDPWNKLYDPELSRARVASVERYLLAAGIDRDRLHIEGRTAHDGSVENGLSDLDAAEKMDRILRISLDSRSTQ